MWTYKVRDYLNFTTWANHYDYPIENIHFSQKVSHPGTGIKLLNIPAGTGIKYFKKICYQPRRLLDFKKLSLKHGPRIRGPRLNCGRYVADMYLVLRLI
jgi:hypothetical protein